MAVVENYKLQRVFLAVALAAIFGGNAMAAATAMPNVVFVLADDKYKS